MEEKRRYPREFPRRTTASLQTATEQKTFRLLDESEGGIGLFGAEIGNLASGQIVQVLLSGGESRDGLITQIRPHSRGGFHVGISWT